MALRAHRWIPFAACITFLALPLSAQVFVVGEKSATEDVATDFTPTNLQLPADHLSERGRRELIRMLEAEQGFAHRALPMGPGLTLRANGPMDPGPDKYKKMLYEKGQSAAPGDRVVITAMLIKGDRIIFDLNGGPYVKHRFLSHIQFNDSNIVQNTAEQPTGARVTLVFSGGAIPEISAPEVKSLLEPVIDFGVKSSEQAYADTLPKFLREAIAAHDVLVGMNHRMVLAALGAPESKMRERQGGDPNSVRYEEWIYGHVPQTVRFVRFIGDSVSMVEVAELGKPVVIHDQNELAGYQSPVPTREIALGDRRAGDPDAKPAAPPTLRKEGEPAAPTGSGRVQFPSDPSPKSAPASSPIPGAPVVPDHL